MVKSEERNFGRDEVIFREGDVSDAAYIVVAGHVELTTQGPDGPVLLAMLGPAEMFGEMGILDDSPRSATARASERSRVRCIPRQEFRAWLQSDPEAAMQVVAMLVSRLRAADAVIAGHAELRALAGSAKASPLAELVPWLKRVFSRRAKRKTDGLQPFVIGIATVNNDIEGGWTRALIGLLDSKPGLVVKSLSASLKMEAGADQTMVNAAAAKARQLLAREESLDLIIWGDVHSDGFSLWFTAHGMPDDDRPGSFSPYFCMELPADQASPVPELIYVAALAAIEPLSDKQRSEQREFLKLAIQDLPGFPGSVPVAWNMEQQRTGLIAYGHALATMAALEPAGPWLDRAADVYRAAINRLSRKEHCRDEPVLRKHLGGILQVMGERTQSAPLLEQAVEQFRGAVECLVKASFPIEWGGAQNRLGLALYKLDLLTGKSDLLKEAMNAFQAALQVFPRTELPLRWAEVMHNTAQVLQVFGDQMKSPDVLERAIDACKASLEFHPRARMPMVWAAGQNTLGTALFLLAKQRQNTETLDEAAAAFTGALEVYRQMGASRPAAVAEKNLAHLEKLKKIARTRKVAMPDWAAK